MTTLTTTKLALTAVGLILVGYGMRVDSPTIRWIGIAFVFAAFLLRFVKQGPKE